MVTIDIKYTESTLTVFQDFLTNNDVKLLEQVTKLIADHKRIGVSTSQYDLIFSLAAFYYSHLPTVLLAFDSAYEWLTDAEIATIEEKLLYMGYTL